MYLNWRKKMVWMLLSRLIGPLMYKYLAVVISDPAVPVEAVFARMAACLLLT
jgi:hypothetical protein